MSERRGGLIPSEGYLRQRLEARVAELERRLDKLEKQLAAIDERTMGSVMVGGCIAGRRTDDPANLSLGDHRSRQVCLGSEVPESTVADRLEDRPFMGMPVKVIR